MKGRSVIGGAIALLLLAAGVPSAAFAQDTLQPYQLVRSLQLIQDRIAGGDHAALPMQAKLLEMVDARLRDANAEDFKEPKNFRALLVYGMSGGNPVTVAAAASRAITDAQSLAIAKGVVAYLNGRPAEAIETLKPIDPMSVPADIGAFLALVKGSLLATDDPAAALTLLDVARLLSPGTLVEEAALRRSVGIAAARGDAARFALASTQYVASYLYSPYASQFADAFVSGVITLHMAISQDKIADITSMMDPEREKVIYLRIARHAAIDGMTELSAFASAKAERGRNGNQDDPRTQLYSGLSTMTSASVDEVRAKLGKIDRSQLSQGDRDLLDAAQAVAGEVVAPVKAAAKADAAPATAAKGEDAKSAAETSADPTDADLPPVEGAMPDQPAVAASGSTVASSDPGKDAPAAPPPPAPQPAQTTAETPAAVRAPTAAQPVVQASAPAMPDPQDPIDAAVTSTRRQLDQIDQLLGAAPK
ncbi:chemotaxis protein MotC [Mesorhizobium sp. B4-1-3]|uniref:chemotaxis protein MotC n=1 Tax=Mesorhizobium sp. B4-1-3 TaxID=2589889 RepID=UPI00112867C5|nr:chemotaxis protein MotC [Mesorhizobium sp. B4-1-3]TPI16876.1 chemotaxis protein MotC [Mesorhizobium sp. B4-1-3]